jgi:hypothetical protein
MKWIACQFADVRLALTSVTETSVIFVILFPLTDEDKSEQ